jgi:cellobiose-specific phosphotransferase system component IIC
MTIGLAVLGAMVVLVMYLILSRFQYTVRESTTTVERVGLAAVNVFVALTGIWAAAKIAHDYAGGKGFTWAFIVGGILCPIVGKQLNRRILRS